MARKDSHTVHGCKYSIKQCRNELMEELKMRRLVYGRKVNHGRMKRDEANAKYRMVKDAIRCLDKLEEILTGKDQQTDMFP